tara:strand:+ start:79 stop:255 length:177 start_codon:yes stop_codon:yes gene_type:complete
MDFEESQLYYIADLLNKEIGRIKYEVKRKRIVFDEDNITYCYSLNNILKIAGVERSAS